MLTRYHLIKSAKKILDVVFNVPILMYSMLFGFIYYPEIPADVYVLHCLFEQGIQLDSIILKNL